MIQSEGRKREEIKENLFNTLLHVSKVRFALLLNKQYNTNRFIFTLVDHEMTYYTSTYDVIAAKIYLFLFFKGRFSY